MKDFNPHSTGEDLQRPLRCPSCVLRRATLAKILAGSYFTSGMSVQITFDISRLSVNISWGYSSSETKCMHDPLPSSFLLKELQYNWSAHRSTHLFIIALSSHSDIKRKQPQILFFQYSCSVTMINMVKKYLWRKIHELNTLIGCSDDS